MNTLYFERNTAIGESTLGEESWKIDLSDKLNSRSPFHNTYWDHFATSLLSICCCCLTSHWLKSPRSCYSKRKKVQDKWAIASEKFHSEVDLHTIVNLQRVSRFLQKLQLARWQSQSVSYFRRYTIEDYQVIKSK